MSASRVPSLNLLQYADGLKDGGGGFNALVSGLGARAFDGLLNAIRHPHLHTPCQTTKTCMNCQSADRLCNTWSITEKSFPPKRIKIILINEPLGL